jgi:mannosyltransferase
MRDIKASRALLRLTTPLGMSFVVVAILLLAFALRLYRLADSNIWWDEGWSVWLARQDLWSIALRTAADEHPPLHYLLLHFWDAIVGESAFAVRFSSLALGTLTVALLYRMGKSMVNGWLGLLAALLLAISRFHIWWSQEIKMYSLAAFLSLLSLYLFLRLLRDGDWRLWLSFVLVNALALWTHYLTILILLAENGTILLQWAKRGDFRPPLIRWATAQVGLILLFAPWLYLTLTHPTTWSSPPPFNFPLFLHMAATVLSLGVTVEIERYLWPTLGFVVLVVVGLTSFFKGARRERQATLLLALTLFVPPLAIYLLSLPPATSFYAAKVEARYLLILLPAYLLLLAWGISLVGRRGWLLGLLASSFVVGSLAYTLRDYYAGRYLKDDYATLVGYIESHWQEGDGVVLDTDFSWPIFLYYYKEGPWHGIPNALGITAEEAESLLSPILAQHPGVWLLMSPDSLVQDPQGLIPTWLGSHAREVVNLKYGDKRLLLYSQKPRELCVIPPENLEVQHRLSRELAPGLWLEGYDLPLREVRTGDLLRLVSHWRTSSMVHQITVGMISAREEVVKEVALPLEAGCPEGEWREGVIRLQHDLAITSEIPSGRYALILGVEGGERLNLTDIVLTHTRVGVVEVEPQHPMTLLLGEEVRFKGFDLPAPGRARPGERTTYAPGEVMRLILHWEAASEMENSYVVFTHLLGKSYNSQRGNFIWGQVDSVPLRGSYPTTGWSVGERVRDEYRIPIEADAPAGEYELEIGMYEPVTGERLLVYSQEGTLLGDRILLEQIRVEE